MKQSFKVTAVASLTQCDNGLIPLCLPSEALPASHLQPKKPFQYPHSLIIIQKWRTAGSWLLPSCPSQHCPSSHDCRDMMRDWGRLAWWKLELRNKLYINSNLRPIRLSITNILTQPMQNQPYMFLLATLDPALLALPYSPQFAACSPSLPASPPSTSTLHTPSTLNPGQFYPLSYASLCLPYSWSLSLEQLASAQPVQNIQIELPTDTLPGSSSPSSPHPLQPPLSDCSIKIEESASPAVPVGGCKKRTARPKPRKPPANVDKQYNPNKPERPISRKRLHQNQNRNVVPNEINQILSFIQKPSKSGHLVARLLRRFPERESYSLQRFYLYQGLLRERVSHYTNERSLRLISQLYEPEGRVWPVDEQRYYNRLCRLLVRHFLLEDSVFIILTSKRMKSQKKIDHLRARRKVAARVLEILREG